MFVSIYYKPSLFNAHTMILIFHIFMNVNKLCLNQTQKIKKQNKQKTANFNSKTTQNTNYVSGQTPLNQQRTDR